VLSESRKKGKPTHHNQKSFYRANCNPEQSGPSRVVSQKELVSLVAGASTIYEAANGRLKRMQAGSANRNKNR